ncbi:MAG: hypothetical protein QM479_10210 [Pseudomonadota bacterium]
MKKLLLLGLILLLSNTYAYAADDLYSHERFETGPMPKIINYDTEFRPPMPMPQTESMPLSDEEFIESSTPTYEIKIIKKEG